MKEISFEQHVTLLKKDPRVILEELTTEQADLIHMGMGVSGEAGELLDAVKAHTMYQKDCDLENVIEELGDLEFYMEGIRQTLGISREDTLAHNMKKLSKRYPTGTYSNADAIARADKG